jgi:hypothetical protein
MNDVNHTFIYTKKFTIRNDFFINIVLKDETLIPDKDAERWKSNLIDKLLGIINHIRNKNSLESTQFKLTENMQQW